MHEPWIIHGIASLNQIDYTACVSLFWAQNLFDASSICCCQWVVSEAAGRGVVQSPRTPRAPRAESASRKRRLVVDVVSDSPKTHHEIQWRLSKQKDPKQLFRGIAK